MKNIKSVVVFCASASGNSEKYANTACELGNKIAELGLELVYGGGKVGLMGAVADGVLEKGGKVTGIIPDFMTPHEIAHQGLTELIVVKSMHERKLMMHEKSDAVITLPGGFGTFEELFEILTWIQLGLYQKPVAILNQNGYYDDLKNQLAKMMDEGLLKKPHGNALEFSNSVDSIFAFFQSFKPIKSIFNMQKEQS